MKKIDKLIALSLLILVILSVKDAILNKDIKIKETNPVLKTEEEVKLENDEVKEDNKKDDPEIKSGVVKLYENKFNRETDSVKCESNMVVENDYDNNKLVNRVYTVMKPKNNPNRKYNILYETKSSELSSDDKIDKQYLQAANLSTLLIDYNKLPMEDKDKLNLKGEDILLYDSLGLKKYNGWYISSIAGSNIQVYQKNLIDSVQHLLEIEAYNLSSDNLDIIQESIEDSIYSTVGYYYEVANLINFLDYEPKEGELNRFSEEELEAIRSKLDEVNSDYVNRINKYTEIFINIKDISNSIDSTKVYKSGSRPKLYEVMANDVEEPLTENIPSNTVLSDNKFASSIKELKELNKTLVKFTINGNKPEIRAEIPNKNGNNLYKEYMYFKVNDKIIDKNRNVGEKNERN